MRRLASCTLVLVLGLTIASVVMQIHLIQAAGETYYVDDDNCPGPGTGAMADPFCKIQDGIDASSAGDTVQVFPGTYIENITMKSGLVIQGAGAGDNASIHSIIDGGGIDSVVTAIAVDSAARLDGFKITNGVRSFGGGMYNGYSSPTVTNCIFSQNSADYGGGMHNLSSSPKVTNCTFSGNSASFFSGGMRNWSSSPTVTNCILWGDTQQEIYNAESSSPVVTYSDIQGGYTGTGNISADPMFLDPDGPDNIPGNEDDDLHLKSGSPCIDTGTATGAPDTDLEGNIRPQGAGYDMGAYESPFTKLKAIPWIPLLLLDD